MCGRAVQDALYGVGEEHCEIAPTKPKAIARSLGADDEAASGYRCACERRASENASNWPDRSQRERAEDDLGEPGDLAFNLRFTSAEAF